ncbi:hypothetical protein BRARA_K00602 [Brassica rapa]|uniref:Uncharacterized protein n=1 Tax=Brassica campestris TaxID=3711 RepID=A0A397L5W3_BRACM|nr:hypothetical protein BRARA_K00602 [Brassica rapa]
MIGRCMNPVEQEMKALFTNLPKSWKLEDMVTGSDLGFGKFQFDFKTEEDLDVPFHFDYWMLALARWQPKQVTSFPSEIMFWIKVIGVTLEFRTILIFERIGGALRRVVDVDVDVVHNRVQAVVDAFKELCFETTVDFKGGEFYDREEVAVSLRYEKLFGFFYVTKKNLKQSPERRREIRDGNGGWNDGAKHEDLARSYKGVVINGQTGQHNKERDNREYYGKGKAFDAQDSKWVKAGERGSRRPPNNYGNYRGTGEGSRFKNSSQEDVRNGATDVGTGAQESRNRLSSEQSRGDQGQRVTPQKGREEGEIKSNGEATGASIEFQIELAKTQAEGPKVIMEATDEERGLLTVQGMMDAQDDLAEDIDMEMKALNATMLEEGVDLEADEEF